MRKPFLAPTLIALTLGAHPAGADDRNGFVGTWLGTWPNGLEIELTVTDVDEDGYVQGIYCNLRQTGIWFADLRREGGTAAARIVDDVLSFKISKTTGGFALDATNDALKLTHKRSGKNKKHLTVNRIESGECANRVVPLS